MNKAETPLFRVYMGVGIFAMGLLAAGVIFTVIMRYVFALSWKELEEFLTTLFAFTTFWGMGICVLKNEHVVIDALYNVFPAAIKKWVTVFNYLVVFAINGLFFFYSLKYVQQAGHQLSMGMGIPMRYMYGIMPLCALICAVCIVIKTIEVIRAPVDFFAKEAVVEAEAQQP